MSGHALGTPGEASPRHTCRVTHERFLVLRYTWDACCLLEILDAVPAVEMWRRVQELRRLWDRGHARGVKKKRGEPWYREHMRVIKCGEPWYREHVRGIRRGEP